MDDERQFGKPRDQGENLDRNRASPSFSERKLRQQVDYRNKRVQEEERYNKKIVEKSRVQRNRKADDPKLKIKQQQYRKKSVEEQLKKKSESQVDNANPEGMSLVGATIVGDEVYDPLAKDMDNDGVIDRYDNDFRDSDYFESTYDVEDSTKTEAIKSETKKTKSHKMRNYSDELFTRSKKPQVTPSPASSAGKAEEASFASDKKLARYKRKQNKLEGTVGKNKSEKGSKMMAASALSAEMVERYLATGSSENVGVEGAEKAAGTARTATRLQHGLKDFASKSKAKRVDKLNYKIQKRKSKLEFKDQLTAVKQQSEYQKAAQYKKFLKRKQMKASIAKKNGTRLRDRVKKAFTKTAKSAKTFISKRTKGILFGLLGFLGLTAILMTIVTSCMSMFSNGTNHVATTSYLSPEPVMKSVNQNFSAMENDLARQLQNVRNDYPGYDEYIVNNAEYIGHNVHELLSYITSRYGEVKDPAEVQDLLDEMFQAMYHVDYKVETETRYRTATMDIVDEYGNVQTITYQEPYEYKKLTVTLQKREMDSVIREIFADYPDNLLHYEALFAAQGNMAEAFANTDLIQANGGVGGGQEYEASSDVQKKIVDAAYMTPSPGAGWCAMWVSQVYQNAGLGYIGGNANDMYRNYTFTSDRSKLQVGMIVAVESCSNGGEAGEIYGHVGIYIGDGKVMDNIGHIRVTTLDDWIATFCQHHPVGFGFPPSVQN